MADALVICSGTSTRHVASLAQGVQKILLDKDFPSPEIEGIPGNEWVLVDTGDIVVHIFLPELRNQYNLEKMWAVSF